MGAKSGWNQRCAISVGATALADHRRQQDVPSNWPSFGPNRANALWRPTASTRRSFTTCSVGFQRVCAGVMFRMRTAKSGPIA